MVPATPAAAKPIESAPASRPTARPDSEYDLFNVTTDTAEKDPPPKNDDHPMRHGADWRGRLEAVAASAGQAGAKVRAHTNELRQSLKQRLTELAIERDPWKIVPIAAVVIVIFIFLASDSAAACAARLAMRKVGARKRAVPSSPCRCRNPILTDGPRIPDDSA